VSIAPFNPGPQRSTGAGTTAALVAPVTTLAAPTPADQAPVAGNPAAPRFADLLRRSRNDAPAPAPAAPAAPVATPSPADDRADASACGETSAIEAKAAPTNAAKARAATPKGSAARTVVADNETKASGDVWIDVDGEGVVRGGTDGDASAAGASGSPACSVAAAPTALIATDASPPFRRGVAPEVDEGGGSEAPTSAREPLARARAAARDDAKSERQVGLAEASASIQAAPEPGVVAAFADAAGRTGEADSRPTQRSVDAVAASFAAGAALHPLDVSPPVAANVMALPTPIDSPDFAAALGVQVSVLAKGGVQQAELHLNPNELGPVSIHISLDGSAARVDFGADVAATREAIERGLPELASALHDAGFTLAGGGVSQHGGGRSARENDRASAGPRGDTTGVATTAGTSTAPARVTRRVAAGGVDLYA